MNYVLGKEAAVASDFTIDVDGHIKLAILAIGQVGENRLGRIVQRLLEIETYKSLAMLTLPVARDIFAKVGDLNSDLTDAVHAIAKGEGTTQDRLDALCLSRHGSNTCNLKVLIGLVERKHITQSLFNV
ncbi:MAG: DUF3422 domain-containing protein [Amylibacter sp.]